jgi:hypothetical protein
MQIQRLKKSIIHIKLSTIIKILFAMPLRNKDERKHKTLKLQCSENNV